MDFGLNLELNLSDVRKNWMKLGAITGIVLAVIIAGILSSTMMALGDLVIQLIQELWNQTISKDALGLGFMIVLLAVLVILMPVFAFINSIVFGISSKILDEVLDLFGVESSGYRAVIYVSAFSVVLVFSFELLATFIYSVITGDVVGIQGVAQTIAALANFVFTMVLVIVSSIVASVVWTELLKNSISDLKI